MTETLDERGSGSCEECGAYLANRDAVDLHAYWHLTTTTYLAQIARTAVGGR